MVLVTGAEAKYRALRAKITGQEIADTLQDESVPLPDVYHETPDPFATDVEAQAGVFMPVELFAVIESSLRRWSLRAKGNANRGRLNRLK